MEILGIVTLILSVMGALAFIRLNKLEGHLRSKGYVDDEFDSLENLGDWTGKKETHERY